MTARQNDLLEALEQAILQALKDTEGKERNDAIANGIRLIAIKHRIRPADESDYFGSASGGG